MLSKIEKFNKIAGKLNTDVLLHDRELMWVELQNSSKRVLEEAQEMYDAAMDRDILEVLDGAVDVKYTIGHTQILLEMMNIDVVGAGDEICDNNLSKFSVDDTLAQLTVIEYTKQQIDTKVEYNAEEDCYAVLRVEDSKVMKPVYYENPDISGCIPKIALQYLQGGDYAA